VAKGNNGNYFQHAVELAVAMRLAYLTPSGRLHVALTHGMAPFEACGQLPNGQSRGLLQATLAAALRPATSAEPLIVAAYRATDASLTHYPNTGELLAPTIGKDRLSGSITEVDPQKYVELQAAWKGFSVTPVMASWRSEVIPGGIHFCTDALDAPWLFSMDPMTYRENNCEDDNKLYREDRSRISIALNRFASMRMPGVAILFVYAVKPADRPLFWAFADDVANDTGMLLTTCWLTHHGGNRNLAAVLSSGVTLSADWIPNGVNSGR